MCAFVVVLEHSVYETLRIGYCQIICRELIAAYFMVSTDTEGAGRCHNACVKLWCKFEEGVEWHQASHLASLYPLPMSVLMWVCKPVKQFFTSLSSATTPQVLQTPCLHCHNKSDPLQSMHASSLRLLVHVRQVALAAARPKHSACELSSVNKLQQHSAGKPSLLIMNTA